MADNSIFLHLTKAGIIRLLANLPIPQIARFSFLLSKFIPVKIEVGQTKISFCNPFF